MQTPARALLYLPATSAFYTRIIGLQQVARPDFGYPGAWLGVKLPGGLLFR